MHTRNVINNKLIAFVSLCILLIVSVTMVTGAYFTDSASTQGGQEITLTFGSIEIDIGESTGITAVDKAGTEINRDLMPGDTIKINLEVDKVTDTQDFYWNARGVITIKDGDAVISTINGDWQEGVYNTMETTNVVTLSFLLDGDKYSNTYKEKTVIIGYEVRAIQMANLTETQAEYAIKNNSDDKWVTGEGLLVEPAQ